MIRTILAGFASVVSQKTDQASGATPIEFETKGSKFQGATHGDYGGGCKKITTPSRVENANSKCR